MGRHEEIRMIMDRELGILNRRLAKSGPRNHFAVARYDALREVANSLHSADNSDLWGSLRSVLRSLDALAQLHPVLRSGYRAQRTIERSAVISRELLSEIDSETRAASSASLDHDVVSNDPIELSGEIWKANSYAPNRQA